MCKRCLKLENYIIELRNILLRTEGFVIGKGRIPLDELKDQIRRDVKAVLG